MHTTPSRGLRPGDYDADRLAEQARTLAAGAQSDSASTMRFNAPLSVSVVRLLTHLHAGRTRPRALGFRIPDTHGTVDFVAMAQAVSTAMDVPAAIAMAEPRYAGYHGLLWALARYRAVAGDSALHAPAPPRKAARSGALYEDAPALRRWLAALGDLAVMPATVSDSLVRLYDPALVEAVRVFQARHGLHTDAVLGPATVAALRVPAARRVRQLALERWRWLPDVPPSRYAVGNIPAFRLYVEDDSTAARPVMRMDVIVGQAYSGRRTPVFTATMEQVVLHPYWDVPINIARNELIPRTPSRPVRQCAAGLQPRLHSRAGPGGMGRVGASRPARVGSRFHRRRDGGPAHPAHPGGEAARRLHPVCHRGRG
jgi:murein L,D-transpeptidase YcbB/YkuD